MIGGGFGWVGRVKKKIHFFSRFRKKLSRIERRFGDSSSSSSSSSAGDLHLSTPRHHHHHPQPHRSGSVQKSRRQLKLAEGDENHRPSETARSLHSLFPIHQDGGKNQQQSNRSKPLKENGHRLDTPTLPPPSRSRLNQQRLLTSSAAARLLRLSVSTARLLRLSVKTQAQKAQAERMFYSLGLKMSELSDSVQKKRIELQRLLRVKVVKEIVESQIPSLEQWTTIEEEYSTSLTETSVQGGAAIAILEHCSLRGKSGLNGTFGKQFASASKKALQQAGPVCPNCPVRMDV